MTIIDKSKFFKAKQKEEEERQELNKLYERYGYDDEAVIEVLNKKLDKIRDNINEKIAKLLSECSLFDSAITIYKHESEFETVLRHKSYDDFNNHEEKFNDEIDYLYDVYKRTCKLHRRLKSDYQTLYFEEERKLKLTNKKYRLNINLYFLSVISKSFFLV